MVQNFAENGEPKKDYGELYACCKNYPDKCSACTRQGNWDCPLNKEQPPEIENATRNVAISNIQHIVT